MVARRMALGWSADQAVALVVALLGVVWAATPAQAQLLVQRSVGGVSIDAKGVLDQLPVEVRERLRLKREQALAPLAGEFRDGAALRKVSLRRLEAALAERIAAGKPPTDDMKYMAGLTRVQYVFVYPEQNDIVLAGPGEGWKVDAQGEIVGTGSGKPVLLLDDWLVALRSAESVRGTGISCSIDPTSEGLQKLQSLSKSLRTIGNPQETAHSLENTLGPQIITVTGIPDDNHFASVIVAADYKMKRLAMGFDKSPVAGIPSFLEMAKAGSSGMKNMLPRWWLAPNYEALLVDPEGLAFELRGGGVQTMVEEDFFNDAGVRQSSGTADATAQRWAASMTSHYDQLAGKEPVFAELRNCIDLSLAATLIVKQRLAEKANLAMPTMRDAKLLPTEIWASPKTVASRATLMKKGRNWLITVSGGVKFQPWSMVESTKQDAQIAPVRARSASDGKRWWWN